MKRLGIVALWIAFCGLALAAASSTGAQVIEDDPCVHACYQEKAACVEDCAQHPNPMECDSECHEAVEDCVRGCRG